jgi:hypothetical protein
MEYTITELKGTYDSKYPDSKKYVFRLEGYDYDVSAFSKFPMNAGDKINGRIEVNGQYHNFKFGQKVAPSAGVSDVQYQTLIRNQTTIITKLDQLLGIPKSVDGPSLVSRPTQPEDDYQIPF